VLKLVEGATSLSLSPSVPDVVIIVHRSIGAVYHRTFFVLVLLCSSSSSSRSSSSGIFTAQCLEQCNQFPPR